jgi:enoyl-CoA hydratase/carnithine racemase
MGYETVLFETSEDKVATITINRPEAANSFNRKMCEEFRDIWDRVKVDNKINAVVLRAAPGRAWCAGTDVHALRDDPQDQPPEQRGGVLMYEALWNQVDPGDLLGPKANGCWKPVVAAVHGMACGGAFYWLNESDIVICSEDATFFDPHVTYGQVAALEPIGLRQRVPLQEVLRMICLGNDERIGAQTALRISLVTEVVKLEALWPRAHELAAKIAAKPTTAVQGSLRAVWESLDVGRRAAIDMGLKYCLLGNPYGVREVNREALMTAAKRFEVR